MRYSFIQENPTPVILCASLLIPMGVLQYYLYTLESSDARVPRFSTVEASLESQRRLVVPITIVTAASGNHICAFEAFLYHLNDVLNGLNTSPVQEVSRRVAREQRAIQYVDTSPDMAVIRRRAKKKKIPAAHQKSGKSHGSLQGVKNEKRQEGSGAGGHSSIVYEIRPKVVVYSLGMGPTKRKRRIFRALVEAGYMDEVYDFDFDRYPDFWALGTETRGEYGWKAGIIDEVSQRFLGTQSSSSSLFEKRDTSHHTKARIELIDNEALKTVQEDLGEVELQSQAAWDSQDDEGTLSEEDNEALDELEEQEIEQGEEETEQGVQDQNTIEQQPQQGIPQIQQPQQADSTSTEKTISEPTQEPSPSPSSPPTPHEPGIVLWLDSGDRTSVEFLRWLPSFMLHHGLWTPQSQDTLWTWTHPGMLAYFHDTLDRFPRNESNCNGAALALDVRNATVREGILHEWVDCAKTKECIAPEGSSRANHRQDQAALTYLVKTMGYTDVCVGFPEVYSLQVNQDKFCKEDIAENVGRVVPRI